MQLFTEYSINIRACFVILYSVGFIHTYQYLGSKIYSSILRAEKTQEKSEFRICRVCVCFVEKDFVQYLK